MRPARSVEALTTSYRLEELITTKEIPMRPHWRFIVTMTGAATLFLSASSAWAQATQPEVEALPMPPAAGELVWDVSMANVGVNTGYTRFTPPGFWTYAV